MSMSIPYELTGRRDQKARTRQALVDAAREFIARGVTPTVEQAAATASISRTTAYRYFASQRALLVAAHPFIETRSLLGDDAPTDPEARLDAVVEAHLRQTVEMEPQFRTMLRLSLEPDADRDPLLLRKGRAIAWIEDALAPLRSTMPEADVRRLALAIRAVAGIEALVWLTDIAGSSRDDAVAIMGWAARSLLRTAIREGAPPVARRKRGSTNDRR